MSNKKSNQGSRKHLTKRQVVIITILFLLITGGIVLTKLINGPAVATIEPVELPDEQPKEATKTSKLEDGEYIRFKYPGNYEKQTNQPGQTAASTVEQLVFKVNQDIGTQQLTAIINKLPSDGIDGDSAYRLRRNQPTIYKQQDLTINNNQVVIMSRIGSYEKTAFMVHDTLLAIVTLSSSVPDEEHNNNFQNILESWQWK